MAASVSNLDQDMKHLRLSRYTPTATNELRFWIEQTLGDPLPAGDLLNVLKDGTILCRLANLTLTTPIKFKTSNMPFIQRENISRFLTVCEAPPFNIPSHDRFLTVDLFDAKDPAQVLQCISAFSRVANSLFPTKFRSAIGPKRAGGLTPSNTGGTIGTGPSRAYNDHVTKFPSSFGTTSSPASSKPSPIVPPKKSIPSSLYSPGSILTGGYGGGASQGNQGISFGARRQITSVDPVVPSLAEKERIRREKEALAEQERKLAAQAEQQRQIEIALEEEKAKADEERRWEEETKRARERERAEVEQQKKDWEEEERKWKEDEEKKKQSELNPSKKPVLSGQFLSEYQYEHKSRSRQASANDPARLAALQESKRVQKAKEREMRYVKDRFGEDSGTEKRPASPPESNVSWSADDRDFTRMQQPESSHASIIEVEVEEKEVGTRTPVYSRPLPIAKTPTSGRPLPPQPTLTPTPKSTNDASEIDFPINKTPNPIPPPKFSRPLPNPSNYVQATPKPMRTMQEDVPSSPASPPLSTTSTQPPSTTTFSTTSSISSSANPFRKSFGASSFMEAERARERQKQKEWEEAQVLTAQAARNQNEGTNPGQTWDVNQYGFVGGDSQNKGDMGIGIGGRRQIIGGPRPRK